MKEVIPEGDAVLNTIHNDISIAISIDSIKDVQEFGSRLFKRGVTGISDL